MTMASANTWADAASDVGAGDPAMAASSLFPGTGFIQAVSGTPALAGGGGGGLGGLGGVTTGAFNGAPALGGLASGSTGSGVAGASTVAALPAAASLVDSGRAAAQEAATRLGTGAGLLTKPLPLPLPLPLAIDALPAVPEPATAVLWLAGLAAMVGLARLRRVA